MRSMDYLQLSYIRVHTDTLVRENFLPGFQELEKQVFLQRATAQY